MAAFLIAPLLASGCTLTSGSRYVGIAPVIDPVKLEQSSNRISRVMNALAQDAGGLDGSRVSYYGVAQAGFNYVDDRCMEYFSELFYLNRRKEAVKAGLEAFNQTSNAIMAATGASGISMAAVAQAFGLAASLTDIAAGTYLYQLPPSTTLTFVKKLQGAYRRAVALRAHEVNSPTAAYHLIQDYLSLCLPPVIEAKLVEHVADATAAPARGTSLADVEIVVDSETPAGTADLRAASVAIVKTKDSLPPVVVKTDVSPGALNTFESRIDPGEIAAIQRQLCTPASGRIDDTTRAAIDEFFRGVEESNTSRDYPSVRTGGVTSSHMLKLRDAVKSLRGKCDPSAGENAFEIGRLVS